MNPEIDIGVGPAEIRRALDEINADRPEGITLTVTPENALTIAAVLRGILDGVAARPSKEYEEPEDTTDPEWIGPVCLVLRLSDESRQALKELKGIHMATAADLSVLHEALTSGSFDSEEATRLCAIYMQETMRGIRESSRQHPLIALMGRHAPDPPPEAKH